MDLCEFEASLIYTVSSRPGCIVRPCLNIHSSTHSPKRVEAMALSGSEVETESVRIDVIKHLLIGLLRRY